MSAPSGPGSRVPIPRRRLRFDRRRAARRRGFVVFLGAVVVAIAALGWVSIRGGEDEASTGPSARTSPTTGSNGATGASGSSGSGGGTIVPGETPIEHVVFIVKENRTFNNYFATYPGSEGAVEGGTIRCDEDGCRDGPMVDLQPATDVQPHDLTHCFRCGLTAINGGKMNGFNHMNGPIPQSENADLYGADLTNYSYLDRKDIPNYWAYADR